MLHVETVEPKAFSLLSQLMQLPALKDFYLVGGTALSLFYGHRKSDDLDLFSTERFGNEEIVEVLKKEFQHRLENRTSTPRFGIFCFIDDVKVDLVRHSFPLIAPQKIIEGVRMFSIEDLIAMKVQAVLGRGKKKDFWDIAELLAHYSVEDVIRFHQQKYTTQNLLISVPQAITYFKDADESEDPVSLKNQTWKGIQRSISERVSEYLH